MKELITINDHNLSAKKMREDLKKIFALL